MFSLLLAISLLNAGRDGISLAIDGDRTEIDPGRSVFLSVTLKYPKDVTVSIPDLRGRVRGFSLAEDFAEPVKRTADLPAACACACHPAHLLAQPHYRLKTPHWHGRYASKLPDR